MSQIDVSQFPAMVKALVKPGEAILASLTPFKCDLYHMSDALAIEGAELADAVKRFVIYEKDLDAVQKDGQSLRQNIVEELGDMEFYMEHIRELLGITRDQTLIANIGKLGHRYKEGTFSNESANNRDDKDSLLTGVDVYAVQNVSQESGTRSFMGGSEATVCGQRYLLSISSPNQHEYTIAQSQLTAIYDIILNPEKHTPEAVDKLELFKTNNSIRDVYIQETPDNGPEMVILYVNDVMFTYGKKLNTWVLKDVNAPEKNNG